MKNQFQFGEWQVHPAANRVANPTESRQMEPRAMDVLMVLCQAQGGIVSSDELLDQCWGSKVYGDNPVHKTVTQLRRVLGDSAAQPRYIETIRKRGYRALASVAFGMEPATDWEAGSPFRGLLAFDQAHARVFFGRAEATRQLASAATAQAEAGYALLLVLGPSGAGKTSLVQAGLLPALAPAHAPGATALLASTTLDLLDCWQQSLSTALAGSMLDLEWQDQGLFRGLSAHALGQRLESGCADVAAEMAAALARPTPGPRLRFGIFIDRLEVLFDQQRVSGAERDAFLGLLERLAHNGAVLLVLACRNDFYPELARHPMLMRAKPSGGHFDLASPGFTDLAQIIRLPAAAAGLRFEVDPASGSRLDDVLCGQAANRPDALPLLQYCLQELYRLRSPDQQLTFAALQQVGGIEGAIGQRAEQVIAALSPAQQATLPHIMSLLVVLSGPDDHVACQRAPWSSLQNEAERHAVSALVDSRLLVSDLTAGVPCFGVAHEAILRSWPRLEQWIAVHRGALRNRSHLAQQTQRWASEGRSPDLLLPRGKPLDQAVELLQTALFALTPDERQLIQSSRHRARRWQRLRLAALAAIVLLAALATLLGLDALRAKHIAEQRRIEAEDLTGFMLGDFADRLRPLGRLDLLDSVSSKALQYLGRLEEAELSAPELGQRARALQVIAEVSRSRGNSRDAIAALSSANQILRRQYQAAPRDTAIVQSLGTNAYWMGQLYKDQNRWDAAADAWREYLVFADLLNQIEPDKLEWWVEQSYAHNNLGSLALVRGDLRLAAQEFSLSIALKKRALQRTPDAALILGELADSYSWLASTREFLGELGEAGQLYAQEMQLVLRLRELFPSNVVWIKRQARALQHRAAIGLAQGRDQQALQDYRGARTLFAAILRQDPNNRTWQAEITNVEQEEQRIVARSAAAGDDLPRLQQLRATWLTLTAIDPKNMIWSRRTALSGERMAAALLARRAAVEARLALVPALDSLEHLYVNNPANLSVRMALADALLLSAEIHSALQDQAPATAACQRVYRMLKDDGPDSRNYLMLDPWVRVNYCLDNWPVMDAAVRRLDEIGYRDNAYLHFLSTHPNPKGLP